MNSEVSRFDLELLLAEVQGVAGATTRAITVPAGEVWRLAWAQHSHNSVGAQTGYWVLTRGGLSFVLAEPQSVGANVRRHIYADVEVKEPLILRYGDTLTSTWAGMDGGAQITVQYCIEKLSGETG